MMALHVEWDSGCAKRFGLLHMRYVTERCALKECAHGHREFTEAQRVRAQNKR